MEGDIRGSMIGSQYDLISWRKTENHIFGLLTLELKYVTSINSQVCLCYSSLMTFLFKRTLGNLLTSHMSTQESVNRKNYGKYFLDFFLAFNGNTNGYLHA